MIFNVPAGRRSPSQWCVQKFLDGHGLISLDVGTWLRSTNIKKIRELKTRYLVRTKSGSKYELWKNRETIAGCLGNPYFQVNEPLLIKEIVNEYK